MFLSVHKYVHTDIYVCTYIYIRITIAARQNECAIFMHTQFYANQVLSVNLQYRPDRFFFLNNPDVLHLELVNPVTKAIFMQPMQQQSN